MSLKFLKWKMISEDIEGSSEDLESNVLISINIEDTEDKNVNNDKNIVTLKVFINNPGDINSSEIEIICFSLNKLLDQFKKLHDFYSPTDLSKENITIQ